MLSVLEVTCFFFSMGFYFYIRYFLVKNEREVVLRCFVNFCHRFEKKKKDFFAFNLKKITRLFHLFACVFYFIVHFLLVSIYYFNMRLLFLIAFFKTLSQNSLIYSRNILEIRGI